MKLSNKPLQEQRQKKCSTCTSELPNTAFSKQASSNDGLSYVCRGCCKKDQKSRRDKRSYEVKRARFKKGILATRNLQQAVKSGRVVKEACWFCGDKRSQGHHLLYDFPLKVIWLCAKHHAQTHSERSYE